MPYSFITYTALPLVTQLAAAQAAAAAAAENQCIFTDTESEDEGPSRMPSGQQQLMQQLSGGSSAAINAGAQSTIEAIEVIKPIISSRL